MSGCESCTSCGVRTRSAGPLLHLETQDLPLSIGDRVVVQVKRSQTLGRVVTTDGIERRRGNAVGRVVRKAADDDLARQQMNEQRSRDVFRSAREKIRAKGLKDVDVVQAAFTLDMAQLELFYVSEAHVDLSEVATQLSIEFRTEVEMRPIGVRDRVKLLGAVGICGLETCCSSWLEDFHPVSVKMAKVQDLSLNETRLTGVCGRLKCCLAYESRAYERARRKLPRFGKRIETEQGIGRVVGHDVMGQKVRVELEDGTRIEHVLAPQPPIPGLTRTETPAADATAEDTGEAGTTAEVALAPESTSPAPTAATGPDVAVAPADPASAARRPASSTTDAPGAPTRKRRRRRGGRRKGEGGPSGGAPPAS